MTPTTNATPIIRTATTRYGLLKARIGSDHLVRDADGIVRQYRVRERARFQKAKAIWRCLTCKTDHGSESALISAHPETAIMQRQEERHVYAMWSDEPSTKDGDDVIGLLSDEA